MHLVPVLCDLVILGEVGIEVVLPMKLALRRDCAGQRDGGAQTQVHRPTIEDGQRTRQTQARGADECVRRSPEDDRAGTEHLRCRAQLDVNLQPDGYLEVHGCYRRQCCPRRQGRWDVITAFGFAAVVPARAAMWAPAPGRLPGRCAKTPDE